MEITFIQITKDELIEIINQAVRAALNSSENEESPKILIKGIHELAAFLNISPSRAQKLKNEKIIPFWQDGRLVIFDSRKVLEAMREQQNSKKKKFK